MKYIKSYEHYKLNKFDKIYEYWDEQTSSIGNIINNNENNDIIDNIINAIIFGFIMFCYIILLFY